MFLSVLIFSFDSFAAKYCTKKDAKGKWLTSECLTEKSNYCMFGDSKKPKESYDKKSFKDFENKAKKCQKECDKDMKGANIISGGWDACGQIFRSVKDEVKRIKNNKSWPKSLDWLKGEYTKCISSGKTVDKCFKACEYHRSDWDIKKNKHKMYADLLNQDCEHIRDLKNTTRNNDWSVLKKQCHEKGKKGAPFKDKEQNVLCCQKLNEAVIAKGVGLGILAVGAATAAVISGPAIIAGIQGASAQALAAASAAAAKAKEEYDRLVKAGVDPAKIAMAKQAMEDADKNKASAAAADKDANKNIGHQMGSEGRKMAESEAQKFVKGCKGPSCMSKLSEAANKVPGGLGQLLGALMPEYVRMVDIDCNKFLKAK